MRVSRWLPNWRREALRTTLWLVPAALVAVAVLAFVGTYALDRAAYSGDITLPRWVETGSASAARLVLSAIAAAVMTVVGVVFSVTIVVLTLASQQFGPRMLRTFIRDLGTQFSLGAFVATSVYAVLTLGSVRTGPHGDFVPHLSITVALAMLVADLVVLIYFIHHTAISIQLPQVIAGISADLSRAIAVQFPAGAHGSGSAGSEPATEVLFRCVQERGSTVAARRSGYLQFVRYEQLVAIAESTDTVLVLLYRPGHFITAGLPLARVWPPENAEAVTRALHRAHIAGAHRTLTQDPVFPIDQLVEIAIRALSPAVNDTFTALTCIDWLTDALCKISAAQLPEGVYRDRQGKVRLFGVRPSYERIVGRASDKIRQASVGMPAVAIRQLEGLGKVASYTQTPEQRAVLTRQAERIMRGAESEIADPGDLADVRSRLERFLETVAAAERHPTTAGGPPSSLAAGSPTFGGTPPKQVVLPIAQPEA
jgi:uncharacterized membrane protein